MLTKEEIAKIQDEDLVRLIWGNSLDTLNCEDGLYVEIVDGFGVTLNWNWNDFINYVHDKKIENFIKAKYLKYKGEDIDGLKNLEKLFNVSDYEEFVESFDGDDEDDKAEAASDFLCQIYHIVEGKFDYDLLRNNISYVRKELEDFLASEE